MISTGPTGILRIYLLKPCSGSPSVSFNASSLIFNRYLPLATAVVISLAVYAMGRPICSVSSFARTSCLELRISRAFVAIVRRLCEDVNLYSSNACSAARGSNAISEVERPSRMTTG